MADDLNRRHFLRTAARAGSIASATLAAASPAAVPEGGGERRVRVAVIGCGSVAGHYLPTLQAAPHVELVAACDRLPERAEAAARKHSIPHHCGSIAELLAGPPFELLVNLTDIQEHAAINERAVDAGRHVWSEKPLATRHEQARALLERAAARGVHVLGAPTVVDTPQFRWMLRALREGMIGEVAAAHASYGHSGPTWSPFFYERGGGSLFDLGIYSIATLTGLLGPARSVVAMTSIVTPERTIAGKGRIRVEAEDNAMLVMEHDGGALAHVQSGFSYFTAREHGATEPRHHTLTLVGTRGSMHLAGYDWGPHGVDVATRETGGRLERREEGAQGYSWENGAARMAAWLAGGARPPFTAEHAAHLVEIIEAAHESQASGRRIRLVSKFPALAPDPAAPAAPN